MRPLEEEPQPASPPDSPGGGEEEREALLRRLWRSDELIRQLKHIVKAQHGKIEELRERLDFAQSSVRQAMAQQEEGDFGRLRQENEDLRRAANKSKAELAKARGENETLRKVNRRLKAMVAQEPPAGPFGGDAAAAVAASQEALSGQAAEDQCTREFSLQEDSALGTLRPSLAPPAASPPSSGGSRRQGGCGASTARALPPFPKAARLISSMPLFWRDMESPVCVLQALLEVAGRLLSDRPSTAVTLYVVDPWLRQAVTAAEPKSAAQTVFYLGQGKTELQVFTQQRVGARPEAPRFGELQALPHRTQAAIAVAVSMPNSHRHLAVLQAACCAEEAQGLPSPASGKKGPARAATPRVLKQSLNLAEAKEPAGFTDAQLTYLQLVCSLAASSLFYAERLEQRARRLERMRECLDVAVAVNKARSLPDFEQRVKHLLGPFFGASVVRVLFFDPESQKLLVSSAQLRRKDFVSVSIDTGVVGLCAKRRIVIRIGNISQHPYVDAVADGLQRSGKPVASNSSMLCGPLVVDSDEGGDSSRLFGVVQLLERKKKLAGGVTEAEFTAEEEERFQQLLQVFAHAGWRTLRAHELAARLEGSTTALARLLAG